MTTSASAARLRGVHNTRKHATNPEREQQINRLLARNSGITEREREGRKKKKAYQITDRMCSQTELKKEVNRRIETEYIKAWRSTGSLFSLFYAASSFTYSLIGFFMLYHAYPTLRAAIFFSLKPERMLKWNHLVV